MTYRELKKQAEKTLDGTGFEDAKEEAEQLFYGVLNWTLSEYLEKADSEADPEAEKQIQDALRKRAGHEPLQLILGKAPFYGYEFLVDGSVLIPRFDTETLVYEVLREQKNKDAEILDLCTGSGCIGITLQLEGGYGSVTLSDISPEALETADRNARLLQADVKLVLSDLFGEIRGHYDVIVSNPPYISPEVLETLSDEVRLFDPVLALDGGKDGLEFYERIIPSAAAHLKKGGALYLEIGDEQGKAVRAMMEENGFSDVLIVKDLAGRDRVVKGRL